MGRDGVGVLTEAEGLALFDAAQDALAVAVKLDLAALRAHARSGYVPPLLRGLVRVAARRTAQAADGQAAALKQRLDAAMAAERQQILLDLVRADVAVILGYASADAVEPGKGFLEIGFDSLTAVELRNGLGAVTGLRLPATLIFDHPSPEALATFLHTELAPGGADGGVRATDEITKLEAFLAVINPSAEERADISGACGACC